MEVEEQQLDLGLDKLALDLAPFLITNPEAKLEMSEGDAPFPLIKTPWGDPSVVFNVPSEGEEYRTLVGHLNSLKLPPRLSALYHKDTNRLEVIFTARALSANLKILDGRAFDFHISGKHFKCYFGDSSEHLLSIARISLFPQNSSTRYRSLGSFFDYVHRPMGEGDLDEYVRTQFNRPLSFFVDDIEWAEEDTLNILRHISFYLRYYDGISPFILIHPPEDTTLVNPKERYVHGDFPTVISTRELNPTLLSFWIAAADAAPENRFLYCYRIIEFVSSSYLKNEKLLRVRKVLSNPALASNLDASIDTLVGLIREDKPDGVNRFKAVVSELTRPEVVWPEICANPQAFTQAVKFDGGFALPKLVDGVDDISRLAPTTLTVMAGHFRNIRNALAHGGEEQAGRVILPTARNIKLLQPWVHLIVAVSGEVVLHENHT